MHLQDLHDLMPTTARLRKFIRRRRKSHKGKPHIPTGITPVNIKQITKPTNRKFYTDKAPIRNVLN